MSHQSHFSCSKFQTQLQHTHTHICNTVIKAYYIFYIYIYSKIAFVVYIPLLLLQLDTSSSPMIKEALLHLLRSCCFFFSFFLLLLLLVLFYDHYWRRRRKERQLNLPPGGGRVVGWPLVGETFAYLKPHPATSVGEFMENHISR